MEHHHHHHSTAESDAGALAEVLDLDAEVLHAYLSEVIDWVHDLTARQPPARILDLGSGTGAGTLALLQRFAGAEVVAVDMSEPLLDRLKAKARDLGVADRIQVVQADLDEVWPPVGPVDLVWASASLHHLANPDRVLGDVFAALAPGGLLAVAELDSFPRFLPTDPDPDHPGLEARCHAALAAATAHALPTRGSDWASRLRQAGSAVEAERHFTIELTPPLPAAAGRYAQVSLRRMRSGLEDKVSAGDLAALDTLLDGDGPDSLLRRDDLTVRATRTVWMARRGAIYVPASS